MVIVIVTDFLAFVLMHTQKNESQEYQTFGREFWRKIRVCVYTFLCVQKEILQDVVYIGRSLSPFVKDLPRLRKEYRETRRRDAIPIDDEVRFNMLEDFIEVFENNELDSVLMSSLQSILEMEGLSEIV